MDLEKISTAELLLCKMYKHHFIGISWRPALSLSVVEAKTALQQYYPDLDLASWASLLRQDLLLQVCEVSLLCSEFQCLIHVTLHIGQCNSQIAITDKGRQILNQSGRTYSSHFLHSIHFPLHLNVTFFFSVNTKKVEFVRR